MTEAPHDHAAADHDEQAAKVAAIVESSRIALVTTVAESGMEPLEMVSWYGLWGPKDMDPALVRERPDLVMVSMPAFGGSGPWRDARAYGSTLEHASGLPSVSGQADWPRPR